MKTKFLLTIVLLFFTLNASSAHLIGGRFQYFHLGNNDYRIELIIERDCGNGGAGLETTCIVGLYSSTTNTNKKTLNLTRDSVKNSPYNYGCNNIRKCVEIGYYSTIVNLPPSSYYDPLGYYLQWERCCYSGDVINIINSENTPFSAVIDIPATTILNNSPRTSKVFNPLICVNTDFSYQFGFVDPDGDSLVYKFIKPWAGGYSSNFNPQQITGPKPYDYIEWETSYSDTNFIDNENGITLNSKTGLLSMKPTHLGKFVFGISIEEFRNGEKIGTLYYQSIIHVNDCASLILSHPEDQYSINNSSVTFKVKHSDTNATYKWELLKPNGLSEFILNSNKDSLVLDSPNSNMNGYKYRCIILKPSCNDFTNYATLHVLSTGINNKSSREINLHPNPSSSIVYFDDGTPRDVKIYSVDGKIISEIFNCTSFDVSNLDNGLYFIRVKDKNGFGFGKFIKE